MRALVRGVLALSLLFGTARWAAAGCDLTDPATATAVANARSAADTACGGCANATNHGQYVSCVAQQANGNASLPTECRGFVKRCAARSTCGKPGFITCCKTKSDGTTTKCSTKHDRAGDGTICTDHAPPGGHACVGSHQSCCDACTSSGCAP